MARYIFSYLNVNIIPLAVLT